MFVHSRSGVIGNRIHSKLYLSRLPNERRMQLEMKMQRRDALTIRVATLTGSITF